MDSTFSKPIAELSPLGVSATPKPGQGLSLDGRGLIPTEAREIRTGTAANRPAASAMGSLFYFATDTLVLSYSDGSAWSDEAGIDKTIVDAKGDLIVGTAADTVARLAVGANGTVLTADSAASSGLKWAPRYRKVTSKTVSNTVTATDLLNAEITLAANDLSATGKLRMKALGYWIQNSGATQNSIRFQVLLGGTIIIDSNVLLTSAATNSQNLPWEVELEIHARNATNSQYVHLNGRHLSVTAGSTASVFGTGTGIHNQDASIGGYAWGVFFGSNTTSKDMTASQALELKVILPAASANISCVLESALVEIV